MIFKSSSWANCDIDGLMQERRNSSVLAMDLRLFCTIPLIYKGMA